MEEAKDKLRKANEYRKLIVQEHISTKPTEDATWLKENFDTVSEDFCREWEALENSLLRPAIFYEPMSIEEKMGIIKAMPDLSSFCYLIQMLMGY